MDENSGHAGLSAARMAWSKGRRGESGALVAATGVGAVGLSGGESCVPRVGDLPIRAVPIIPAHLSMAAARKIAELKRANVLFVERDGRLMGTLDEHALVEAPDDAQVTDCLRSIELCLGPDDDGGACPGAVPPLSDDGAAGGGRRIPAGCRLPGRRRACAARPARAQASRARRLCACHGVTRIYSAFSGMRKRVVADFRRGFVQDP